MKSFITIAATLALAASTSAFANAHKEAPGMAASGPMTPQQNKMAACNKEAGDKKGDERKDYMKTCLSASKPASQQLKMKTCNAGAGDKKGDERKTFMKQCLTS